jgi:Ankyrin repeats (3 copies)
MRSWPWIAALLVLALVAAPAAHAQQAPSAEPSLPERVLDGVSGAVRGFFKSIFGERPPVEGEIPLAPPAASPASPPASSPASPADITPSAVATQSLQAAIAKGEYPAAVRMIEQGVDVEAKDSGAGASALHYAVMKGEMPLVSLLLQHGADVNSRTRSATTPLHTAVLYRRTEIAEYLIDKGADVNARSLSGATPLGLALAANFHTIEDMLRRRGGQ